MATPAPHRSTSGWKRRAIEVVVALAAFAVWGRLAYLGGLRLLLRLEGIGVAGSPLLDVLSFFIGVAGSIAGVAAVWALVMRLMGKTPRSIVGAPDDSPDDYPQRDRAEEPTAKV